MKDELEKQAEPEATAQLRQSVAAIVRALTRLDNEAFERKMERVRRRDDAGEREWQRYRDAIFDVARELNIVWLPKYR